MKKWPNIIIILKSYLLAIGIFFLFRLILFITELGRIESFRAEFTNIFKAFLMGVRFDVVISGYILVLPFLILSILFIFKRSIPWVQKAVFYWVFILFTLAFIICAADIPYFNQFFSRFSVGAFQWAESPLFVLRMIFEEPRFYFMIIPLIILLIVFYKFLKRIFTTEASKQPPVHLSVKIVLSLLFLGSNVHRYKRSCPGEITHKSWHCLFFR
jgi:hypothetical protein